MRKLSLSTKISPLTICYFRLYKITEDGKRTRNGKNNDITLFVFESAFEYTDYVRPAALPVDASFKVPPGAKCIISGWGQTKTGSKFDTYYSHYFEFIFKFNNFNFHGYNFKLYRISVFWTKNVPIISNFHQFWLKLVCKISE